MMRSLFQKRDKGGKGKQEVVCHRQGSLCHLSLTEMELFPQLQTAAQTVTARATDGEQILRANL